MKKIVVRECIEVIEGLGHSAAAYQAAKERLDRKFGGRRRQIALQFEEVNNFRPIRSGPGQVDDIKRFADLLDIIVINLKDANLDSELDSRLLYSTLYKKMTEGMVTAYHRWINENGFAETVENLRRFIIREAEYRMIAQEAVRGYNSALDRKHENSYEKKGRQNAFYTKLDTKFVCVYCGGDHGIWVCQDFEAMETKQRWEIAKEAKLFYRYLSEGHKGLNVHGVGIATSMAVDKATIAFSMNRISLTEHLTGQPGNPRKERRRNNEFTQQYHSLHQVSRIIEDLQSLIKFSL